MAFLVVMAAFATWQSLLIKWSATLRTLAERVPAWSAWPGGLLLTGGFAMHRVVIAYAAQHDRFFDRPWLASLPFGLALRGVAPGTEAHAAVLGGIMACVMLETIGLVAVCLAPCVLSNRAAPYVVMTALAFMAISASVLTSSDPFFYAYASTLGLASYAHIGVPVDSPYHFLLPYVYLDGNIYGPLWTLLDAFVGSAGHTIHDKIIALRTFNAVAFVIGTLAVRAMGFSRATQLAFSLNPMLWFYFGIDAHNDLFGITLCFFAIGAARRYPAITVVLIAIAGAFKISFILIGCVAFSRFPSRVAAVAAATAATALALIVSWLLAGNIYFSGLLGYAHARNQLDAPTALTSAFVTVVVCAITGIAVLWRRTFPELCWVFPLSAPLPFPWYTAWGLPYVAAGRRGFIVALLLLPFAAALSEAMYGAEVFALALLFGAVFVTALEIVHRRRVAQTAASTIAANAGEHDGFEPGVFKP